MAVRYTLCARCTLCAHCIISSCLYLAFVQKQMALLKSRRGAGELWFLLSRKLPKAALAGADQLRAALIISCLDIAFVLNQTTLLKSCMSSWVRTLGSPRRLSAYNIQEVHAAHNKRQRTATSEMNTHMPCERIWVSLHPTIQIF